MRPKQQQTQQEQHIHYESMQARGYKIRAQQQHTRMLVHFKNCVHDGYFTEGMKREGPGLSILDNGALLLGSYKNDQNYGLTLVYLNLDTYYLGEFNKGALDGPFVIRSPSLTIYSSFTNNRIDGEMLIIDYDHRVAQLWAFEASGDGEIVKQVSLNDVTHSLIAYDHIKKIEKNLPAKFDKTKYMNQEDSVIKAIAPYIQKMPTVSQFVRSIRSGSLQFQGMGPQIFLHQVFTEDEFITFNSANQNQSEFLGFALNHRQQLIAYGQFKQNKNKHPNPKDRILTFKHNYLLNGLGAMVQVLANPSGQSYSAASTVISSGQFVDNELHGEGCKQIENRQVVYGKFVEGSIRNADAIKTGYEKDEEIRRLQLKRNRSVHVHALKFHNNYSNERPIFILRNLLSMAKPREQQ